LSFIGVGWLVLSINGNWLRVLVRRSHATEAEVVRDRREAGEESLANEPIYQT
jgi:hypothetical protein